MQNGYFINSFSSALGPPTPTVSIITTNNGPNTSVLNITVPVSTTYFASCVEDTTGLLVTPDYQRISPTVIQVRFTTPIPASSHTVFLIVE